MIADGFKIRLLGEFSIDKGVNHFPQESKKSMQVILLIAYLIAHRDSVVSKTELIDVLWAKDNSNHPDGALRNLIYRARKEMENFTDEECIHSKGNIYAWNKEAKFQLDVAELELLCNEIEATQDCEQVFALCEKLQNDFSDDFLQEFAEAEWVKSQKIYYNTMYLRALSHGCTCLLENEEYNNVIQLCDFVDYKQKIDSTLHEQKLFAYFKLEQISMAISYYHKIMDLYYSRLGIEATPRMKEIYTELLKCSTMNPVDVNVLEENLNEERTNLGTFYCDFDVFKNVYQINARASRRNARLGFLVLMTLSDSSKSLSEETIHAEADLLKDIIYNDLRKNDVFSKCNPMQYALILSASKKEGCEKAIERIISRFDAKKRNISINLEFEIKDIL